MRIEPASLEDCGAIAQVHVASWRVAYKGIIPDAYLASLSQAQREASWREAIAKGSPQVLVARSGDTLAGFVAFGASRDEGAAPTCGEVWAIYLAPETWSQGVGRLLWLAALERMTGQGFTTVTLWVIVGNERAVRFYTAAGFIAEPGSEQEFSRGGATLREVRYVLRCVT